MNVHSWYKFSRFPRFLLVSLDTWRFNPIIISFWGANRKYYSQKIIFCVLYSSDSYNRLIGLFQCFGILTIE